MTQAEGKGKPFCLRAEHVTFSTEEQKKEKKNRKEKENLERRRARGRPYVVTRTKLAYVVMFPNYITGSYRNKNRFLFGHSSVGVLVVVADIN